MLPSKMVYGIFQVSEATNLHMYNTPSIHKLYLV